MSNSSALGATRRAIRFARRLGPVLALSLLAADTASAQAAPPPAKGAKSPAAAPAPAAPPPAASDAAGKLTPEELAALKEQIRGEVMQEVDEKLTNVREEIRDEARAAATTAAAADTWEAEWQDVKPQLQFFQPAGYLRLRMVLWKNGDLALPPISTPAPWFTNAISPEDNNTAAQADMRLRFEPTFNVSEEVRIKMQIDFFNNLVLGSTPDLGIGVGTAPVVPGGFLTWGQNAPANASNFILVRRAWGEVVTPVGELRFGRMGANWGLGIYANDGNCFDCDHGDTVDRIMFATRIADHVIAPALDFVSEGPINPAPYTPLGEPIDATQVDDARDLVLTILRRDTDEEIRKLRVAGTDLFINYGLYLVYRNENYQAVAATDVTPAGFVKRDANAIIPDIWFRLLYKKYRLELEAVTVQGKIRNRADTTSPDPSGNQALDLNQWGGVLQNEITVADDKLHVRLELGYASGDDAPGFGNLFSSNTTFGGFQGRQFSCATPACSDSTIQNFRFDPDYRIDMLLWREILASITEAVYIRPSVTYALTEGLNLDLAIIYSQAVDAKKRGGLPPAALGGTTPTNESPLGLEIDAGASYLSDDGFVAGLQYGVLFPFAGLNGLSDPTDPHSTHLNAATAQVVRGVLGIVY